MQTRVGKREVGYLGDPLRHMTMPVTRIHWQCIHLQGVILHIEGQILLLTFVQQRVFRLGLQKHTRDGVPRVRLDSGVGRNDAVCRQFLQEIVYLRIFNRLGNTLRMRAERAQKQKSYNP